MEAPPPALTVGPMIRTATTLTALLVALAGLTAPVASAKPDTVHYVGKTIRGGKLRIGVRDGRVVGMKFQGKSFCSGPEPPFGNRVSTPFDSAKLGAENDFRSKQILHRNNPISPKVDQMTREIRGTIHGSTAEAAVEIQFRVPLKVAASCGAGPGTTSSI